MHCALGRPFYGALKMAVITLGRKAPQSNQARIKVGFHCRHNKSSKTRSRQACGLLQRGRNSLQRKVKGYVLEVNVNKRAMLDPENHSLKIDSLSLVSF